MADDSAIVDLTTVEDSVYYLDPNENICQPIVDLKFDGKDYFLWYSIMSMALKCRMKFGFVDGTIKQPPPTDPTYRAWKRCNAVVMLWLINSLSERLANAYILPGKTAAQLWEQLEKIYAGPRPARISLIQQSIFTCRQGNLSVHDYYSKLNLLWAEYTHYRPIPDCRCCEPGKSDSCDTVKALKRYREIDICMCFLNGLNDKFDSIRIELTITDPLPCVDTAFNRVWHFEESMKLYGGWNDAAEEERLFCRYCKKENHVIENCYKLKNKRRN